MRYRTLAVVFLVVLGAQAVMAELIILRSGKTIEGTISFQDEKQVNVKLPMGTVELDRDSILEILSDEEAVRWKQEQEKLQAGPTPIPGTAIKVISRDEKKIETKTAAEIGREDRRFELKNLVDFPAEEGNAAKYYWVVLDTENFKMSRIQQPRGQGPEVWEWSDPIFSDMRKAARLKTAHFYPDYLPYPAGLKPKVAPFERLLRVAKGLIALGEKQVAEGDSAEGLRNLEAALIMGFHVTQDAPVFNQYSIGTRMKIQAAQALANYYLAKGDAEKQRLFNEFAKKNEYELNAVRMKRLQFVHSFNANRIQELTHYALHGDNALLRAYAMELLVMIKLAGEQLPLRKDILEVIPLESIVPFKQLTAGDAEEVAEIYRQIESQDPNQFLRSHARELLAVNALQLPRAIKALLAQG